jgi:hypothetical protein
MMVLIPTRLIERITIRPVAKRRSFISNRRFENYSRRARDPRPLRPPNAITSCGRMYLGQVQYLGSVQISNSRHRPLI